MPIGARAWAARLLIRLLAVLRGILRRRGLAGLITAMAVLILHHHSQRGGYKQITVMAGAGGVGGESSFSERLNCAIFADVPLDSLIKFEVLNQASRPAATIFYATGFNTGFDKSSERQLRGAPPAAPQARQLAHG